MGEKTVWQGTGLGTVTGKQTSLNHWALTAARHNIPMPPVWWGGDPQMQVQLLAQSFGPSSTAGGSDDVSVHGLECLAFPLLASPSALVAVGFKHVLCQERLCCLQICSHFTGDEACSPRPGSSNPLQDCSGSSSKSCLGLSARPRGGSDGREQRSSHAPQPPECTGSQGSGFKS